MTGIKEYLDLYKPSETTLTPLRQIQYMLNRIPDLPGDVLELGCYFGKTSVIFKKICCKIWGKKSIATRIKLEIEK